MAMKNLINFIIWPAVAGLLFSIVILKMPDAVSRIPALSAYISSTGAVPANTPQPMITSYSQAIKKTAPAVVSFSSIINSVPNGNDSFGNYNNFGSGVIISPDGYIITSYHFFSSSTSANLNQSSTITLRDGRTLEAELIVVDAINNLALLKVNAEELSYIDLTAQGDPEVGDIVLAIGNPRNVGQSVSMGIVSALVNQDDGYLIQTDAAINPGNSGGALIDIEGNLIGINSTIVSESGGSEGIGFAVMADKAFNLLKSYLDGNAM